MSPTSRATYGDGAELEFLEDAPYPDELKVAREFLHPDPASRLTLPELLARPAFHVDDEILEAALCGSASSSRSSSIRGGNAFDPVSFSRSLSG